MAVSKSCEVGRQVVPTVHSLLSFEPIDLAMDPAPLSEHPSEERPDMTVVTIWDADYIYSADTILLLKPYSGGHFAPTEVARRTQPGKDSTLDAKIRLQSAHISSSWLNHNPQHQASDNSFLDRNRFSTITCADDGKPTCRRQPTWPSWLNLKVSRSAFSSEL
jgi:hypothetical protein